MLTTWVSHYCIVSSAKVVDTNTVSSDKTFLSLFWRGGGGLLQTGKIISRICLRSQFRPLSPAIILFRAMGKLYWYFIFILVYRIPLYKYEFIYFSVSVLHVIGVFTQLYHSPFPPRRAWPSNNNKTQRAKTHPHERRRVLKPANPPHRNHPCAFAVATSSQDVYQVRIYQFILAGKSHCWNGAAAAADAVMIFAKLQHPPPAATHRHGFLRVEHYGHLVLFRMIGDNSHCERYHGERRIVHYIIHVRCQAYALFIAATHRHDS